jgi:hypothetical protein
MTAHLSTNPGCPKRKGEVGVERRRNLPTKVIKGLAQFWPVFTLLVIRAVLQSNDMAPELKDTLDACLLSNRMEIASFGEPFE